MAVLFGTCLAEQDCKKGFSLRGWGSLPRLQEAVEKLDHGLPQIALLRLQVKRMRRPFDDDQLAGHARLQRGRPQAG